MSDVRRNGHGKVGSLRPTAPWPSPLVLLGSPAPLLYLGAWVTRETAHAREQAPPSSEPEAGRRG